MSHAQLNSLYINRYECRSACEKFFRWIFVSISNGQKSATGAMASHPFPRQYIPNFITDRIGLGLHFILKDSHRRGAVVTTLSRCAITTVVNFIVTGSLASVNSSTYIKRIHFHYVFSVNT